MCPLSIVFSSVLPLTCRRSSCLVILIRGANVYDSQKKHILLSIQPEAYPARLLESIEAENSMKSEGISIPYVAKTYGKIANLPEYKEGEAICYVVSFPVLLAIRAQDDTDENGKRWRGRRDIMCPDTGPASVVRDKSGRIVGIRRFQF